VHLQGSTTLIGRVLDVQITAAHPNSLAGAPARLPHDAGNLAA
jgi:hypothetical protein